MSINIKLLTADELLEIDKQNQNKDQNINNNKLDKQKSIYITDTLLDIWFDDERKIEITNYSLEYLRHLREKISNESARIMRDMYIPFKTKFQQAQEIINDQIINLVLPYYKNEKYGKVICNDNEYINGYQLYNYTGDLFDLESYTILLNAMNNPAPKLSLEEFEDKAELCSDWAKMDEHGESFGGYWNYPEGSYEKQHAWTLTLDHNVKKLWELPYHTDFLILAINYGCNIRQESVRYINFYAVWIQRKTEQLRNIIYKTISKRLLNNNIELLDVLNYIVRYIH